MKKNNKGFTLVEILLALALISIIVLTTTNIIVFSMRGHSLTFNEFNIQSNLRLVSQKLNTIIRDASGVFVLHREDDDNLTEEWNYIMLNEDKSKLLEYVWNSTSKKHDVKELTGGIEETKLDLKFKKETPSDEDKLLEFDLNVILNDKERNIKTKLEAKNALQVVDRSYSKVGNTIAYRYDSRVDNASNAQAVVAMVLDKSGSMGKTLTNGTPTASNPSRMERMKIEAKKLVETLKSKPNINMSIVPFSNTANDPIEMDSLSTNINNITNKINGLDANGGTNTGDGIRRAYHEISEFNELHKNKTNKNFMIILVDGETTFASVHEKKSKVIEFNRDQGDYVDRNGLRYNYYYRSGFLFWYTYYYVCNDDNVYVDGNMNIENRWLDESKQFNVKSTVGGYVGNGNNLDPMGTAYVNEIGKKVKAYKEGTNETIQVYIIGFSGVQKDFGSLEDIAMATRGDTVYYKAESSEALEAILKAIQRDITDALWHIGGPN